MATLKRVEKRLGELEKWAKALEQGSGPAQTMENMNWSPSAALHSCMIRHDKIVRLQSSIVSI